MAPKRSVRRQYSKRSVDPVERRLRLKQRREDAPPGFVTRPVLCRTVGLTESQFRALLKENVIVTEGANPSGYALYSDATVQRLLTMKADGSLFNTLTPAAADVDVSAFVSPISPVVPNPTLHYSAEDGVKVFELLSVGKTLAQIILETRIHPLIVKAIRVDFDDITGSIHLSREIVDKLNELGNDGKLPGAFPLRDPADVLSMIALSARDRTCSTCEINASLTSCEDCLVKERRATLAAAQRSA